LACGIGYPLPELPAWSEAQEWNAEETIQIELQESSLDETTAAFARIAKTASHSA